MDSNVVSIIFIGMQTNSGLSAEHPSDTYVFTMKMEILLESASNKLLVADVSQPDVNGHAKPEVVVAAASQDDEAVNADSHEDPRLYQRSLSACSDPAKDDAAASQDDEAVNVDSHEDPRLYQRYLSACSDPAKDDGVFCGPSADHCTSELETRMTRSSTKKLTAPYDNPKHIFRSSRKLIRTRSLYHLDSPGSNLFSDYEDHFEEEETETMGEPTMEEYMTKTREDSGFRIVRPKIDDNARFDLKGQFLTEFRDNTFSGSDNEDANEHIEKVLEIVDLFHIPEVTQDQIILRVFPMSLTGAASRWLRNEPVGSIDTSETLKKKFLSKYYPHARTAKKMEAINTF
ncbi:hypothetical protein Tco_1112557 [Tanacetum coccineum]|uniref:Retrotransposon gag domain-containing protein n=1 Tax=Tanacetum coccineum TaxID=301880 RepID=A0ABQ5ITB8_9ASTR